MQLHLYIPCSLHIILYMQPLLNCLRLAPLCAPLAATRPILTPYLALRPSHAFASVESASKSGQE